MSIDVGGIKVIDACIQCLMDDADRFLFSLSPAKIHAPQA
jgi:hypothetical protein